jgi:hypothetical protein
VKAMRTLTVLGLIAFVFGCATNAELATQKSHKAEQMMVVYGPACQKLGYQENTDPWRDCVLRMNGRDRLDYYGYYCYP